MADYSDIDRCISALEAVKLTRSYYASSAEGAEQIKKIVTMLGMKDEGYSHPPITLSVARAIHQTYLGPVPTAPEA
ncbi:hypothetical protein [Aureimonas sp. AU22]|uniref:hypothetical protein n=1 Tax=Aureimonas sp. AU22 TaxID=1638162 RepID=UPI0007864521|nr:hypothetical protein [Aureimonas sp. AU22]